VSALTAAIERPAATGVTPAMQDYLKAIYRLGEVGGPVTTLRLAAELAVSSPSVTNMAKRLHDLGLVRHARYHGVALTPEGERVALDVVRRHRLLELFLAETLGYAWDEVHAEAERLEHHVSDELDARMDAALGHPTRDPHGDPIPNREGVIAPIAEGPLVALAPGALAIVVRVTERDPERLRYLGGLGLRPGMDVVVVERMPFEGPLRVVADGAEHVIGHALAASVLVVPPRQS